MSLFRPRLWPLKRTSLPTTGAGSSVEAHGEARSIVADNWDGLFEQPAHVLEERDLASTDQIRIESCLASTVSTAAFPADISMDFVPADHDLFAGAEFPTATAVSIRKKVLDKSLPAEHQHRIQELEEKLQVAIIVAPEEVLSKHEAGMRTLARPPCLHISLAVPVPVPNAVSDSEHSGTAEAPALDLPSTLLAERFPRFADPIRHEYGSTTSFADRIRNPCAEDEGAGDPDDPGPKLALQTSFHVRGGAEVADLFRKLGLIGAQDIVIYHSFQLPDICFLRGDVLHRFEYGDPTAAFLVKLRGGTCTTARPDSLDAAVHRSKHLHGNNFAGKLGREEADLNMKLMGTARYYSSNQSVIEYKTYLDARLVFEEIPSKDTTTTHSVHSVSSLSFRGAINIYEGHKIFVEMICSNPVVLELLLAVSKPQWLPPRLDCNTKLVNSTRPYFEIWSLFCLGWVAVQYRPPWPPPHQLEILSDGVRLRPTPWPSFTCVTNGCSTCLVHECLMQLLYGAIHWGLTQFDYTSLSHGFVISFVGIIAEMRFFSSMVLPLSVFHKVAENLILDGLVIFAGILDWCRSTRCHPLLSTIRPIQTNRQLLSPDDTSIIIQLVDFNVVLTLAGRSTMNMHTFELYSVLMQRIKYDFPSTNS